MRTWLFAPGHEVRKVRKALGGDADFVILDWEDAVPPAEKQNAREVTLEALAGLEPPALQRVVVRVNHPSSAAFAADLAALEGVLLGAVMAPKMEIPAHVVDLAELELSMVLLIESALGVERAYDLACAHPRVRFLAFGPLDLLADIGGHWTAEGDETSFARQRVPIAARAARCVGALDGPWPRLQDLEGLRLDTEKGRRMGYVGRMLIHPSQVPVVRAAYAPSPSELDYAQRVVDAAAAAEVRGIGAISVDGRFVDGPVIRWARQVLASAGG